MALLPTIKRIVASTLLFEDQDPAVLPDNLSELVSLDAAAVSGGLPPPGATLARRREVLYALQVFLTSTPTAEATLVATRARVAFFQHAFTPTMLGTELGEDGEFPVVKGAAVPAMWIPAAVELINFDGGLDAKIPGLWEISVIPPRIERVQLLRFFNDPPANITAILHEIEGL